MIPRRSFGYPTDRSLLNEARNFSEQIIDVLYPKTDWTKKPRTYRDRARKEYLAETAVGQAPAARQQAAVAIFTS